jgi:hypothetical protein
MLLEIRLSFFCELGSPSQRQEHLLTLLEIAPAENGAVENLVVHNQSWGKIPNRNPSRQLPPPWLSSYERPRDFLYYIREIYPLSNTLFFICSAIKFQS